VGEAGLPRTRASSLAGSETSSLAGPISVNVGELTFRGFPACQLVLIPYQHAIGDDTPQWPTNSIRLYVHYLPTYLPYHLFVAVLAPKLAMEASTHPASSLIDGEKPLPADLSHYFSEVVKRRLPSKIKAYYKFFQIPGIKNLAGGQFRSLLRNSGSSDQEFGSCQNGWLIRPRPSTCPVFPL